jgi:hypothetical protein
MYIRVGSFASIMQSKAFSTLHCVQQHPQYTTSWVPTNGMVSGREFGAVAEFPYAQTSRRLFVAGGFNPDQINKAEILTTVRRSPVFSTRVCPQGGKE